MMMSWWCHDVSCGKKRGTLVSWNVSRPSSLYDVIFLEQISGNRGCHRIFRTIDVCKKCRADRRCCIGPRDNSSLPGWLRNGAHVKIRQVWQRWTKHGWNSTSDWKWCWHLRTRSHWSHAEPCQPVRQPESNHHSWSIAVSVLFY